MRIFIFAAGLASLLVAGCALAIVAEGNPEAAFKAEDGLAHKSEDALIMAQNNNEGNQRRCGRKNNPPLSS